MPQFHDPSPPKMGPGMVIGRGGVRGKRLKRKSSMNGGGTNDTSVIAAAQLANDDEFCFPTTSTKQNDSDKTTANKKRVHVFAESSDEEDSGKKQQQKKVAAVSSSRVAGSTKPTKAVEAGSFADKHESQTASKKQTAAVNVRPPAPKNSSTNNHSNKKAAKAPTTATTIPSATGANPGVKKTTITTTKKKKVPATKKKTPTANNDTNKATTPMHNVNARRPSAPAVTVTIHKPPAAASLRPTTQAPTLKFPTEDNYEQPPSLPLNRMAIGFDNRFLETDICRSTGQEYIDECHVFLESLSVRGATPCIIATSTAKEKGTRIRDARRRNAVAVQAHATTGSGNSTALQPVWIAPPTNHNNKVNRQAVYVPRPLSANDSWKHFGEMVESIIEQEAKTQLGHKKHRLPLDVLLVSNDVSLFCDTNEASHKRATSRFWDLVKPFFQDSTLRSIQIVVVKTGTVALAKPPEEYDMNHVPTKTYKSPGTASDEREDDDDDRMEVDDDEAKMPSKESKQAEEESEARSMHEILIAKCTRTLQALLISRSEEAYKTNRSYAAIGNPIAPVEISFTMVDATVHPRLGFKSLFRRCLRDIVSSIMAFHAMAETGDSVGQLSSANSNCIHLELPETLDGTQCSISLEVSYKTLPFSLDRSVVTKGFFSDLNELVQSKMEIVQLVPISCVDASLLFGVPMRVRAGLEGDLEQYQEALVLVQSLFRLMQQKEVAMLLRVQDEVDDESTNKNAVETIFHNTKKSQTFLLMAEEKVAGDCPPSTGILFRYASAEELLLEQAKPLSHVNISLPEEVTKQYESYVDNALDLFECSALNPLYLDATMTPDDNKRLDTKNQFPTSYCDNEEDDLWNDDVGIGALAKIQGVNDIVGKDPKNAMDLDDDNDDNFCLFDYSQVND